MPEEFDSFNDLQCEDVYDDNYIAENDYDDSDGCVTYDDLVDRDVEFEDF